MTEFPDIKDNYKRITDRIADAAQKVKRKDCISLMAVVKTVSAERIDYAVSLGIELVGENRVQELLSHYEQTESYKSGCELHFIGKLQSNKVKYITDKVRVIESADSIKLVGEIDKQAKKSNTVMDILLEINIGNEETKSGIRAGELDEFMDYTFGFRNINVKGLMTIPPIGNSDLYFGRMYELYERNKEKYCFETLSMGMSGDFENAVKYGSNIVRIGSALFGDR